VGVVGHLCTPACIFVIFPQSIHNCHFAPDKNHILQHAILEQSHKIGRIMASIITTLYNIPTMGFQQLGTASHILHEHVPPD
jgi:hypothetical protein